MAADTIVKWIEIFRDGDDGFSWRAKAQNGEVVAWSMGFHTLAHAVDATWAVFPNVPGNRELVRKED